MFVFTYITSVVAEKQEFKISQISWNHGLKTSYSQKNCPWQWDSGYQLWSDNSQDFEHGTNKEIARMDKKSKEW